MTITPEQCRAGRALLGWPMERLANEANVGYSTVADFERGARSPIANNLLAIRTALERGGVVFIPGNGEGPGVRLRKTEPEPPLEIPPRPSRSGTGTRATKYKRPRRRRR